MSPAIPQGAYEQRMPLMVFNLVNSLHAYIILLKSRLNTGYLAFQSLHKAYIKPTQSLHEAYMIPTQKVAF